MIELCGVTHGRRGRDYRSPLRFRLAEPQEDDLENDDRRRRSH
jgi:hypothetical protein